MPVDRFFFDAPLKGPSLKLSGAELHHLARVMRVQEGEAVELVNGKGELASAKVVSLHKEYAELAVESHSFQGAGPEVVLAQALPRSSNLDWIVEKGTELGASAFWLFPGDLSEKKDVSENGLERLKALTISAMKQSGRLWLPRIEIKPKLAAWGPVEGTLLFGDLSQEAKKMAPPLEAPIVFFVGPEKGFSKREEEFLRGAAKGVRLHDNVLRAETAAIAALAQIHYCIA